MFYPGTDCSLILVKKRIWADSKKSTFPRATHPQSLWIHLLKSLVKGLWARTRSIMAWRNPISPQKSLFSWGTGLPHLGFLLIKASDRTGFSQCCPPPHSCTSVLIQDHWSQWLCCSYLGRGSQRNRSCTKDRPALQFQYIRQASRLGSRAQRASLQQEETKL